jgi:hypothetical protein
MLTLVYFTGCLLLWDWINVAGNRIFKANLGDRYQLQLEETTVHKNRLFCAYLRSQSLQVYAHAVAVNFYRRHQSSNWHSSLCSLKITLIQVLGYLHVDNFDRRVIWRTVPISS